jgi:hypothetical protein
VHECSQLWLLIGLRLLDPDSVLRSLRRVQTRAFTSLFRLPSLRASHGSPLPLGGQLCGTLQSQVRMRVPSLSLSLSLPLVCSAGRSVSQSVLRAMTLSCPPSFPLPLLALFHYCFLLCSPCCPPSLLAFSHLPSRISAAQTSLSV